MKDCPSFILNLDVINPNEFRKGSLRKYFKSYYFRWDFYEINQRYNETDNIILLFQKDKYGNIQMTAIVK